MKVRLLIDVRRPMAEDAFAELVVWALGDALLGSRHRFKYRLAYVVDGRCVLRYDNESGKGDHKHLGEVEQCYLFETPDKLLANFWRDVDEWRP